MRLLRWLFAGILLAAGRGRRRAPARSSGGGSGPDRNKRVIPRATRPELLVAVLLLATGVLGVAFILVYSIWGDTQAEGLTLGLSLACLAAALIVVGKRVVPQETSVEERPELVDEESQGEATSLLAAGDEGVSRRGLITAAAGVSGIGLGGALLAPLASLGPNVGERNDRTPWHRGRGVVDEHDKPILADDITPGAFVTGFPQGADKNQLGAPVVIVKLPVDSLDLPAGRPAADWAPEGILAYSKICTHAGCAIALYRYPLFSSNDPGPALVCPCHYSTFDPARGAERIFGPAGRPLPQLPLTIDATSRQLLAGGGFSGSIGPAWFNVHRGASS